MSIDRMPDDIIDQVKNIRIHNNDLWMDLLRLAYKHDPVRTRVILGNIRENDKEVTEWLAKL